MVFEVLDLWGQRRQNFSERNKKLTELVEEISKDHPDDQFVRDHLLELDIPYSDNEIELLNNILKGIHSSGGTSHEGNV